MQDLFEFPSGQLGDTTQDHMWVGLLNSDFQQCDNKGQCEGKFNWIDGTRADSSTTAHFLPVSSH